METIELSLSYMHELASQFILISSLLAGFSITIIANLLVHKADEGVMLNILKVATIAAACFLATVFAMAKVQMMSTPEFPFKIDQGDFILPRTLGAITFFLGLIALSVLIALAGWTKSRNVGIFTTVVGILTFLAMLMMII